MALAIKNYMKLRLSYLILAYNEPEQLERLVKRLQFKDTDIFIHIDKKSNIKSFEHLRDLPNVFLIKNRTAVVWGNYSMIEATLISFDQILKTYSNYSHINLLSGQDYPLKSNAVIQKFLFENADKSFMRYQSILDEWTNSISRLTKYNLGDYSFPFKYKIQALINKYLPAKKIPLNLKPYGLSQWITITPICAKYVIEFLAKNASVKRFFKMTWTADELIFQTILLNSPFKNQIVNDHLRYIKFIKNASRPLTLTMLDSKTLKDSDKFFARKFSISEDQNILDFLDNLILPPPKKFT
jgi:hypothetical protein